MASTSLHNLIHHQTLHNPSIGTKTWCSQPHPNLHSPLLATAASDKSVHVWDMRDWKLLSTINGGHKRSVRCVGWKDYGVRKRRRSQDMQDGEVTKRDPVVLATGSFDANCGLWVWNRDFDNLEGSSRVQGNVPGAFDSDDAAEQDFTNQADDGDEEWHFSMLLTGPDSEIKDLQFSPAHYGANLLATCSRDKSVWVWEEVEPEEWETVAVLSEHAGDVKCVSWLSGAKTSRKSLRQRLRRRAGTGGETDNVDEGDEEELVLGGRELLASGSYDDTIRLHHDDEAEGDWISIAVLTGHEGTVWDIKFEGFINLVCYPAETNIEEIIADWAPRLISCSDDMTIRVWRKILNDKEKDERRTRIADARKGQSVNTSTGESGEAIQTGFSTNRLPSVIRPATSTERWEEEARLPATHVRSIYAVDWSPKTGLIVSCGGDGVIAVYKEFAAPSDTVGDVVMNGTAENATNGNEVEGEDIKKIGTEWKVVALMEAAHEEYEINHVCWAPTRDQRKHRQGIQEVDGQPGEVDDDEYIISTGDDGEVRIWKLPQNLLQEIAAN